MTEIRHPHVFLISDLHLGDPAGEVDHFHSDEQLCAFLSSYLPDRTNGEAATLIILGDFIDFPRIPPRYKELEHPTIGSTEDESVRKVMRAIKGHPLVFQGLRALIERGDQLLLLAGNHDVDLYWPGVRSQLASALRCEEPQLGFVHKGVLRDRGIHVQHGHQLSFENQFQQWPPEPFRAFGGEQRLERCWGTFFMEAVYNLVEAFAPWIDLVHPTWRAVLLALKYRGWDGIPPPVAAAFLAFFARFGKRVLADHLLSEDAGQGSR
ncbi:MAG TPA: metallophosphoesterase, partial [Kofleriaceae bacterium]